MVGSLRNGKLGRGLEVVGVACRSVKVWKSSILG